jgi:hypothetical protein
MPLRFDLYYTYYLLMCIQIAKHYLCMIKRLELIGNGKLWMVLLQRHILGEKCTGANPTDRAKCGTKRSMVVDGKGVPLGITVDAANRHDMKMTKTTLQSIVVNRPEPTTRVYEI